MSALVSQLLRSAVARQFLAFAAVGAVGTGVHYVTLVVGVQLGLDPVTASALGWSLGAVANYLLNYHLTFRSSLTHWQIAPRFALIAASGLVLNTLLMAFEVDWLGLHYLLAQFITTGALLCWNFVLSRVWAFKVSAPDTAASQTRARPVFIYLRGAMPLWLGVVLVAAGGAGFVTSVHGWRTAHVAQRDVSETQATIVDRSIAAASRANGARYLALYRFTANDGTRVEGSQELPLESCERVQRGAPVAVCYMPAEAADAEARHGVPRWVWPLLTGVTGAFAVLGVLLARPGVSRLQTIRRVQRSGVDAQATIVDVAPSYTRLSRLVQWRVRYEFADGLGKMHAGNSELMSAREAAQWSVDDGVAVRFDPNAPHQNLWLGRRLP